MKPHLRKQHCCMIGQRIVHRHYVIDMAPHPYNTSPTQNSSPPTNLPKLTHSLTLANFPNPPTVFLPPPRPTDYSRLLSQPKNPTPNITQDPTTSPNPINLNPQPDFLFSFFLCLQCLLGACRTPPTNLTFNK